MSITKEKVREALGLAADATQEQIDEAVTKHVAEIREAAGTKLAGETSEEKRAEFEESTDPEVKALRDSVALMRLPGQQQNRLDCPQREMSRYRRLNAAHDRWAGKTR